MRNASKLFLLLLLSIAGASQAATLQLYQAGWDIGGLLSITFTGEDSNANGGFDTAELTSFAANFELPGGGVTTFSLADLGVDGFFYQSPFDYFIKADSPDFSLYEIADANSSIAIASDSLGSFIALSGDRLQPVPEPATAALVVIAGIGIAAFRRVNGASGQAVASPSVREEMNRWNHD